MSFFTTRKSANEKLAILETALTGITKFYEDRMKIGTRPFGSDKIVQYDLESMSPEEKTFIEVLIKNDLAVKQGVTGGAKKTRGGKRRNKKRTMRKR